MTRRQRETLTRSAAAVALVLTIACSSGPSDPDPVIVDPVLPGLNSQAVAPRVWVYSCDAAASGGSCSRPNPSTVTTTAATIEFIDGPRAGQTLAESDVQAIPARTLTFPMRIRLRARYFETREFVLSESTAALQLPGDVIFVVPMTYSGDAQSDTYIGGAVFGAPAVYPIQVRVAGQVDVSTYWAYDDPSHHVRLSTTVRCGGQTVASDVPGVGQGHAGLSLTAPISGSASCEVRVTEAQAPYRIVITYPH